MNHFESHLMVSSRVVDSKVLEMAIQFEYFFFLKRGQDSECNVRNSERLILFGMSPDVPAVKVRVFTSDLKFWIGVNDF